MLKKFDEFVAYCKALEGKPLETRAQGKPFRVEVDSGTVFFVPQSSGKRRRADRAKTERVLAELEKSKDWAPGGYRSITQHASYILSVARHEFDR